MSETEIFAEKHQKVVSVPNLKLKARLKEGAIRVYVGLGHECLDFSVFSLVLLRFGYHAAQFLQHEHFTVNHFFYHF